MGVAIAELNQPWLVNTGILHHLGYFHKVVFLFCCFFSIKLHMINLQYYIRQNKNWNNKKKNKTIRTTLALNLTNYHLKFARFITHLFPMLHFHAPQYHENFKLFSEHYKCNIGKRWARMIKFKNITNIKCYIIQNTNAITQMLLDDD